MRTFLSVAAVAALLTGGSIVAVQAAAGAALAGPTAYVQMNSPGDGLDGRRAVREGNARPYRMRGTRYRGRRLFRRYR